MVTRQKKNGYWGFRAVSLHSCSQTFQRHSNMSGKTNTASQPASPSKEVEKPKISQTGDSSAINSYKIRTTLDLEKCSWAMKSITLNVTIRYTYLHCIHTWKSSRWQEMWCITTQPWKCGKSNWNKVAVIAHSRAMAIKLKIQRNVLEVTQI